MALDRWAWLICIGQAVAGLAGCAEDTQSSSGAAADAPAPAVDATAVTIDAPAATRGCSGAAAHWLFDEGAGMTTVDGSGHGHTLTLTAGGWVAGHDGPGAVAFDGATSYGQAAYDTGFEAVRKLSITAWIKPARLKSSYGGLVVKGARGGVVQDWGFYTLGSEIAGLFNWPTGPQGNFPAPSVGAALQAGTWAFVAMVLDVDAGTFSFYKDGAFVSSLPWTAALLQHATPISVGTDAGRIDSFEGEMDSVAVWTRALSAGDVATIFAGGCPPN